MVNALRKLQGILYVKVTSMYLTRFFNICKAKNICVWDVTRTENVAFFYIALKDFYELGDIRRKTDSSVKIISRSGFPFFWQKMSKRKVFLGGLVACFAAIYLFAGIIWSIEIEGNRRLTTNEFQKFVNENGVHTGITRFQIKEQEIEKLLCDAYPYITWCSVRVVGTKLCVSIKEGEFVPQESQVLPTPTDLVADTEGIVDSIVVRKGEAKVVSGNEIKKGDCLISGLVPIVGDDGSIINYQFYDADGDVIVQKSIPYSESISFCYETPVFSDKENRFYDINVLGRFVHVGLRQKDGPFVEIEEPVLKLPTVGKNTFFSIHRHTRKPYEIRTLKREKNDVKNMLLQNFRKYILSLQEKGVQIIENDVKIVTDGKQMRMQGTIYVKCVTGRRIPSMKTGED